MDLFEKLDSGKDFSSARPFESSRLVGMTLPGNGAPVLGSLTTISEPFRFSDCEKSPARSSAVGTVTCRSAPGLFTGHPSCDQKKNSFCRSRFHFLGMKTGPPMP